MLVIADAGLVKHDLRIDPRPASPPVRPGGEPFQGFSGTLQWEYLAEPGADSRLQRTSGFATIELPIRESERSRFGEMLTQRLQNADSNALTLTGIAQVPNYIGGSCWARTNDQWIKSPGVSLGFRHAGYAVGVVRQMQDHPQWVDGFPGHVSGLGAPLFGDGCPPPGRAWAVDCRR